MIKRQYRIERIQQVEGEFLAASSALRLLMERLKADPSWGASHKWRLSDADRFSKNLEATYIIRLFAEFESGLRDYWENCLDRPTNPKSKDLLDAIASNRKIPLSILDGAHEVRRARNAVVHEHDSDELYLSVKDVTSRLCSYLSRLREDW